MFPTPAKNDYLITSYSDDYFLLSFPTPAKNDYLITGSYFDQKGASFPTPAKNDYLITNINGLLGEPRFRLLLKTTI